MAARAVFPPRYAGMEGKVTLRPSSILSFPRATRGWKGAPSSDRVDNDVSPALRGDGRLTSFNSPVGNVFPPRYAGMEVNEMEGMSSTVSFPRATRGWKIKYRNPVSFRPVSPALRGDGRCGMADKSTCPWFPPRYAGMEGCT